jgi:glycosyltransferase involved in cell wall biosynthesis
MAAPDVSVIVPARDAAATIDATLSGLAAQEFGGSFEVIVVDDGSVDATGAIARAAQVDGLVRHDVPLGPAVARNAGRSAAQGRLLAYTDADCVPQPGWLAAGVAAVDGGASLVQGTVLPAGPVGPFDRTLWVLEEAPRLYETANLFVTPEVFDRVGGFRPFVAPGPGRRPAAPTEHFGEDVVFALEARRAGARFAFAADAEVRHAVFPRGPRAFVRERRRLRYLPALVREVPELRGSFVAGLWLSPRSARFDAALAGVACAALTGRRRYLLAAVPYALVLQRGQPWRRSLWRENAARVAADAVSLASLLEGSAAARTPVL